MGRDISTVHVDAWTMGRRFTHDGTIEGLTLIALYAGVRDGGLVATYMAGPVVFQMQTGKFVERLDVDYEFARRGHVPVGPEIVVDALPEGVRELVVDGAVLIVDFLSEEVPDALASQFRGMSSRGSLGFGSAGVACCHLREDGQVMIVLGIGAIEPKTLRHEAIHAAQCFADGASMSAAYEAVVADGSEIFGSIVASGGAYRDVAWALEACRSIATRSDPCDDTASFDLALAIYPTEETAALARSFGIEDPMAVVAVLFAHALRRAGVEIDPSSRMARELVAYRHQSSRGSELEPLFTSAAEAWRASRDTIPVPAMSMSGRF